MRLALRRVGGTRGLVLAAAAVALMVTTLLSALAGHAAGVIATGTRVTVAEATPEERSLLVRGSAGGSAAALADRDGALRRLLAGGLGGAPVSVDTAGYATGRQLTGDVGSATGDEHGLVFASMVFLDDLPAHAGLVGGRWPRPGADPVEVAVGEAAARILGYRVGSRVEVGNRLTGGTDAVVVAGVWRPTDLNQPYWQLVPDAATGVAAGSTTYGPMVLTREDFAARFGALASAGWVVEPDLAGADERRIATVAAAAGAAAADLPRDTGLADSAVLSTGLDRLSGRLSRAALVGRSALVTPMLLTGVLGGYALLLIATMLAEHRRLERALLVARGATRGQLAGLALREAVLVAVPAVLLGPLLGAAMRAQSGRLAPLVGGELRTDAVAWTWPWLAAALAGAGCVLAMAVPSLRRPGTVVDQLQVLSRPPRRAGIQRAGVDAALVALAALGWWQLHRYASPVSRGVAGLGVDPLLAATPIVAVLAGALLALRPLGPVTGRAERALERRRAPAAMLGVWQARRRPHAGPVLLLALAVAASTIVWCLAATSRRSGIDQANHVVGADLRLVEADGYAPPRRRAQLAQVPGVRAALPALRDTVRAGPRDDVVAVVGLDAAAAAGTLRLRDDLAGGSAVGLLDRMARARAPGGTPVALPGGARRLAGRLGLSATPAPTHPPFPTAPPSPAAVAAVVADPDGLYREIPIGTVAPGGALDFAVALPGGGGPLTLAGFTVATDAAQGAVIGVTVAGLATDLPGTVDLGGAWHVASAAGSSPAGAGAAGGTLRARYVVQPDRAASVWLPRAQRFAVTRTPPAAVPAVATPSARTALGAGGSGRVEIHIGRGSVPLELVGTVDAVPGVDPRAGDAGALLVDLPSLAGRMFASTGSVPSVQEWWLSTAAGARPGAVAEAVSALPRLTVLDRREYAREAGRDPFGLGARTAMLGAALGTALLAGVGLAFDAWAGARRRLGELAVLHMLGASPRLLARSVVTERALLAGVGAGVGAAVGVGVAALVAPLIILTPSAGRPVPAPLLQITWGPVVAVTGGLFLLDLAFGAAVALTLRRSLAAAQLRIGVER